MWAKSMLLNLESRKHSKGKNDTLEK